MTGRKRPGDVVELGDVIGHPIEPGERWGRVVGIRKGEDVPPIGWFICREYRDGDGDWPTGGYFSTWCVVPYDGDWP